MRSLVDEVYGLYAGVVISPDTWTEQAIADWMQSLSLTENIDRESAKYLRRSVSMAGRLKKFWMDDHRRSDSTIDWRSRVDRALGPRAWRPALDLAMHQLERAPDEDLFDTVGELFRVVNHHPWLDGMSYEAWLEEVRRNR